MRLWVHAALLTAVLAAPVLSSPVQSSLRPETRRHQDAPGVALASAKTVAGLRPVARPLQPPEKPEIELAAASSVRFQTWISAFHDRAATRGIAPDTLERAFAGITYDPEVIRRDRNQSEFTKTIWDYLDSAASETRIRNGKSALEQHRDILDKIEAEFGVEKEIVVAVWGLESAYGSYRGSMDVIRSLATLAFDGRRGAFFEGQLIAALEILQAGDVAPRDMTGSWAGAMGHTQFIPTSFLDYAVDFTGDGRRDIWSDDPSDALASTAAYLARFGWTSGQPWGIEVGLPNGFDYAMAKRSVTKLPSEWARLGVTGMDGKPVADYGPGAILLPAGSNGAAFMIFDNFAVLERYNTADAYVIGVGHLSDRISGGPPVRAAWPRGDRALNFAERQEMQRRLTARGFDTQGIDGRIGPRTTEAVRAFQAAEGLTPDGYASLRLLEALR